MIRDPHGNDLSTTYDTAGNPTEIVDPDADGPSIMTYDGVGNLIATVNPRVQGRTITYDALDRPIQIHSHQDDATTTITYRADELQAHTEQGPGYQKILEYDGFGRVLDESVVGGPSAHYEYDRQGRVTAISNAGVDKAVRWNYAGAYLQSICTVSDVFDPPGCNDSSASWVVSSVTYDSLGRRKSMQMGPAGHSRTFKYRDEGTGNANLPRDLVEDRFSTLTLAYAARDPLGNLLGATVTAPTTAVGISATLGYGYDQRNRVASWSRTNVAGQPNLNENFGYDALGNMTTHGNAPQNFNGSMPHQIQSRGSTTYAFDESGNMKRAGNRYYTFDSAERLVKVGSSSGASNILSVVYDAAGQRVSETSASTTRKFLGSGLSYAVTGGNQHRRLEVRAFGETVAYVVRDTAESSSLALPALPSQAPPWLFAIVPLAALGCGFGLAIRGGLLIGVAQRPAAGTLSVVLIAALIVVPYPFPSRAGGGGFTHINYTRFVISDLIGSAAAVFDDAGLLIHATRYKPFGKRDGSYDAPGATQKKDVYADHAYQEDAGLVYMNARWQDPETGTFLSIDPILPNLSDPQQHNAYSYARNNPVNATDPTGRNCVSIFQCGMAYSTGGLGASVSTTTYSLSFTNKAGDSTSGGSFTTISLNGQLIGGVDGSVTAVQAAQAIGSVMGGAGGLLSAIAAASGAQSSQGSEGASQKAPTDVEQILIDEYGFGQFTFPLPKSIAQSQAESFQVAPEGTDGSAIFLIPFPLGRLAVPSSRALGAALEAAGYLRPAGAHAHHLVAGNAPAAAQARAILQRFGIGVNDAANGVFLPATVHQSMHTTAYYQTVNQMLGAATTQAEAVSALGAIRSALLSGGL